MQDGFQTYDANLALTELDKVRRHDGNAIPIDCSQFYIRFLATSASNTLQSLGRVGITVHRAKPESAHYDDDGEKGVWRPLYLFSGPTLIIMLIEAVVILACKLNSSFFFPRLSTILFSETSSHAQYCLLILAAARRIARACDQDARPGCAPSARDIHSRNGQFTTTIILGLNFAFQFQPPSLRASLINSTIARVIDARESPAAALADLQSIETFVAAEKVRLVQATETSAKQMEEDASGDVIGGKKRHLNLQRGIS